ncbi:MAG: hypothetical protein ACYTFY_11865 [Planctomycetota bacterium]|jgi:hypothetical protein
MNTTEKMAHHFKDKVPVWVPMWGISKLRRRGGNFAGAIEGKSLYYDKWYDRAMSEDTAEKLARLGVNLVILPFSLGGSEEMERSEHEDFEKMTAHLHKHGIVSLPYFQYQNILQEEQLLTDTEWAINLDGSRRGFAPWRRAVCHSTKGFIDYMKGLTSDALKRDADGIWIDNTYLFGCRCVSCEAGFRKYLAENRSDLLEFLNLKNFDKVEIPFAIPPRVLDPITQAFMEFNCQRNEYVLGEIKDHLESLKPEGLFASNPGIYRGANLYGRGLDLYKQSKLHDIIYLENKLYPAVEDEFINGNYHGYISLSGLDCMTVGGAWKGHGDFDSTQASCSSGMPDHEFEVERAVFEAPTFNNISGMFWSVRAMYHGICKSSEDLTKMYFEKEDINQWMKGATDKIKNEVINQKTENIADVAIYRSRSSLAFAEDAAGPALFCMEEMLLRNRIPYRILFSEDINTISEFGTVIIPETHFMSDDEAQAIEKYVKDGGSILVIGDSSLFNEHGFLRKEYALKDAMDLSYFDRAEEMTINSVGKGKAAYLPGSKKEEEIIPGLREVVNFPGWVKDEEEIISNIDKIHAKGCQLKLSATGNIGISISKAENQTIINLMSYDAKAASQDIYLSIRKDLTNSSSANWYNGCSKEDINLKTDNDKYIDCKLNGFNRFGKLIINNGK